MAMRTPFFYRETDQIRITVRPAFLADQSNPASDQYVFAYFVRIENVRSDTVQLMSRRWLIQDSTGEESEVVGDGVVGQQPVLGPGGTHEYQSFCVLKSPRGSMEGQYHFVLSNGEPLVAQIPKFLLDAGVGSGWH